MRDTTTVSRPNGFVLTPRGRFDLRNLPTCDCHIRIVGLLVECPDCGTVYGYTRDSSLNLQVARAKAD